MVVEGIEDAGMLQAVVILGADVTQGYAIAHPMPAAQVAKWLESQPGLPDCRHPETPLGKLATLVIPEERLHLGRSRGLRALWLGGTSMGSDVRP